MKSNKGFTLIELLAVIVILAIIALVSAPIIVGLIDDARKESAANSAYGVLKATENVYAKVLMKNPAGLKSQIRYTFQTNGSYNVTADTAGNNTFIAPNYTDLGLVAADLDITYKGTKPTAGVITLNMQGDASTASLTVSGFVCTYASSTQTFSCS
ncbi:MAG: type II secretion system protein [Bacilli bacterium]|nr:type II secretion system protein [Bacilli bacterium]MDD4808585.1 type II secretion system protein [Bacilli bacterium]